MFTGATVFTYFFRCVWVAKKFGWSDTFFPCKDAFRVQAFACYCDRVFHRSVQTFWGVLGFGSKCA